MDNILIWRNQLFKISETFITNQAKELKKFKPIYVGRKMFGQPPKNSIVISMDKAFEMENVRYVLFRDVSYFEKKVFKYNPKLIHAHFGVDSVYAMKLANKLNIPLITTFHGFDATTTNKALLFSKKPAWINYLLYRKQLAKKGNLFICVSDFIRKKVIELGFPEEKTITHYIGIDTNVKFNNIQKPNYKVILHVARLTEKKGTKYLIKAFAHVYKKNNDTRLIIIGEGPLENELKKMVKLFNLERNIIFLGSMPHNEVLKWMQKADIFCLPSITANTGDSEGLGMVFLEASVYGIPSVGTYHGGIPEVIEDGKTGYLVPEKDVEQLAKKLILLLENDNLRKQMGSAAKKMVEEKFDIKKQTKKLEDIYKELL